MMDKTMTELAILRNALLETEEKNRLLIDLVKEFVVENQQLRDKVRLREKIISQLYNEIV